MMNTNNSNNRLINSNNNARHCVETYCTFNLDSCPSSLAALKMS